MKYDVYEIVREDKVFNTFEFISAGNNGNILKRVLFTPTHLPNVFNLAFGDINEKGDIDDLTVSNNGDRNKILATILNIVDRYTNRFPERYVIFTGSTEQRTRLYRMAISVHLEELSEVFEIYADISGDLKFVWFRKGLIARAFLVKRKILNLRYEEEI
jgi:hypothetical protein